MFPLRCAEGASWLMERRHKRGTKRTRGTTGEPFTFFFLFDCGEFYTELRFRGLADTLLAFLSLNSDIATVAQEARRWTSVLFCEFAVFPLFAVVLMDVCFFYIYIYTCRVWLWCLSPGFLCFHFGICSAITAFLRRSVLLFAFVLYVVSFQNCIMFLFAVQQKQHCERLFSFSIQLVEYSSYPEFSSYGE